MKVTSIVVEKGPKGYGFVLKPIRVYIGDSNNYRIHHILQVRRTATIFADTPFVLISSTRMLKRMDQLGRRG